MKLDSLSRPLWNRLLTLPNKSRLRFLNLKSLQRSLLKTKRNLTTTPTNRQLKKLVTNNNKDRWTIQIKGELVRYHLQRVHLMSTKLLNSIFKHFNNQFSTVSKP